MPPSPSRLLRWLRRLLLLLGGIGVFVLSLQLLKQGTAEYGHQIMHWLQISNGVGALGFGWLLSYVFLSGSPVAAVAVSLFASGTINDLQTFMMITGSRLGASFVVLLIGFVYYLRGHRQEVSVSTGVIALLTTAAIYIPALLPGYWLLSSGVLETWQLQEALSVNSWLDALYTPIMQQLELWLPGWALLLCGMVALPSSMGLIDRALPDLSPQHGTSLSLEKLAHNPLALFLVGAAITSLTLSVSVSISLLVPLVIKGMVQPRQTLPYIMGANITTFIDTLLAAFVAGGPQAFTIVLVEMVSVCLISLAVLLLCYSPFERGILALQALMIRNMHTLAAFIAVMFVLPVLLLLL